MSDAQKKTGKRRAILVNAVTLARVPLAIVFAVTFLCMTPSPARIVVALILLAAIELTDMLDGVLARRLAVVSETGATLDPYADSVSRLVVYWALAVAGVALAAVPLVMALRDVTVAYCRVRLARQGRTVAANPSGKVKAVVQGTAALLLAAGPLYHPVTGAWTNAALSWIVIVVTAWSAVAYVRAATGKDIEGAS